MKASIFFLRLFLKGSYHLFKVFVKATFWVTLFDRPCSVSEYIMAMAVKKFGQDPQTNHVSFLLETLTPNDGMPYHCKHDSYPAGNKLQGMGHQFFIQHLAGIEEMEPVFFVCLS